MTSFAADSSGNAPLDNDFSPGLFIVVLLFCGVLLVLIGVGIVIGLAILASTMIFVALGVISTSALVAMMRRRFSAGFRALYYQLSALVALPCGIGVFWLSCSIWDFQIRDLYILAIGAAVGVLAGVVVAYVLERFIRFACRRFFPGTTSEISS